MKKQILFFTLLPLFVIAQIKIPVSPNLRDENGLRTGHWTILCDSLFRETHTIDSVRYFRQALFEKGKPVGILRDYYLSGRKQWEGVLLDIFPDVFDGAYTQYHENGQLYMTVNYKNNKQNGYKKVYYASGNLYFECNMVDDKIEGKYIQYHENGNKQYELNYVNNKADGLYTSYYPSGGLEVKCYFKNDSLMGSYIAFYENGKMLKKGEYNMGRYSGKWKFYYENGQLKTDGECLANGDNTGVWNYYNEDGVQNGIRTYVKGLRHGKSLDYFPDKTLETKGKYTNDLRDSIWCYYYPSGKLKKRGGYIGDSAWGKWEYFYESGKIEQKGYFKNNKYDSTWTFYYPSGKISNLTAYKNNAINGYCRAFHENGQLNYEGNYTNADFDGYFKVYYANGKVKQEGLYVLGKRNGLHRTYYENGQLKDEGKYVEDVFDGFYKKFYENGNKEEEGKYILGKKDSIYNEYHENGQLRLTTNFVNGVKNGFVKKYYASGIQETDGYYKNGLASGTYLYRHENGNPHSTGEYLNDEQEGIWVWYHPTGELKNQETYQKGKFFGEYICYYKNGKVKYKGYSKNGQKNGYYKSFDSTGLKTSEGQYVDGLLEGRWTDYYSLSGKKKLSYGYLHNKLDGKYITYNEDKSISATSYYIRGFKETSDNISDSIVTLRKIQDYNGAIEATKWLESVIKRDFKEPEKRTEAIYQYANIYYEMKNYNKSLEWWRLYGERTKKYYGDTVNNYAVAQSGIAINLTELGRYDESLKAHDVALIAFEKAVGRFSDNYLIVLHNKTRIYHDLKQYDKKEKTLLDELAIRQKKFPNEPIQAWKVYKYLANFYYEIDKYTESIKYFTKLKNEIIEEYLKKENSSLANTKESKTIVKAEDFLANSENYPFYRTAIKGLIKCYEETKEYRTGINELTDYLLKSKKWSYETSFERAECYNDLGRLYRGASIRDTSANFFNEVLNFASANQWADNDIIKEANLGLGNLALDNEEYAKAAEYYYKVVHYFEQIGFDGTNSYANVIKSYGFSLYNSDKKNAPLALRCYLRSTQIKKEIFGETELTYLETAMKTAEVYTWNFKYHKADSLLYALEKPILDTYGKEHYLYIYFLEYISGSLFDQSRYKEAIPYYQKLCDYYKAKKDKQETYAVYLSDISTCYKNTGEKLMAKDYLIKAMDIHKVAKGVENETYYIYRKLLARMLDDENLIAEAEKIYKELVLSFAKTMGNPSAKYAKSLNDLGYFYYNNSNYEKSLAAYQKSKETLLQLNDNSSDTYINTLNDLSKIQESLRQYAFAEKTCLEAKRKVEVRYGKNSLKYAESLKRLASIYLSEKIYDKALKTSLEANAILKLVFEKEEKETADFQKQLASIYSQMDRNKEAEELYFKNITIYENILGKKNTYYLNALDDLYQFYVSFGQFSEAEKIVNDDIAITKDINIKDKLSYANKLSKKGNLMLTWKKYAQADTIFKQVLKIREGELAPNDADVITTKNQLGICALYLGNIDEAEKAFNFCVNEYELKKETTGLTYANYLFNLGTVNLEKKIFDKAEKQYNTAFEIQKKYNKVGSIEEINLLDNFASLYQAWGKYEIAEKYWLDLTSKLLKYIQTNFYFLSDKEKAQFWLKNNDAFESFNTFAILRSPQNPQILGSMYNYQLSTKAILLSASNKIKKRILSSPDSTLIQSYYRWVTYKEALSKAYILTEDERKAQKINLVALETEANKLEKSLNITSEEVSNEDQTKTVGWKDIQKTLTSDEAVVEIVRMRYFDRKLTDSIIYAALILTTETKNNPTLIVLPNGKQLEKSYLSYYKNAIALKIDDENSYQSYWAPIHEKIKNKSQLYISLDGVYNSINLQSLQLPNGKYLLEEKNIKIVSNSKDVIQYKIAKSQNYSRQTAVLLGFPKYFIGKSGNNSKGTERSLDDIDRSGISELPGTKTEIEMVNAILSTTKWDSKNYLGEEASESTLKSIRNPRILHIATHGFFVEPSQKNEFNGKGMQVFANQQNPLLRSGLLLSGAANFIQNKTTFSDENGVLTAYEAANLNLDNTDLVILSACETGKGEISNGEGVYGLQRAFQVAGAKAVIMSLWKVNDTATQELMTSFYQQWMSGVDKQKAFKSAQMQLKEKYKSPYYWGAFVMVGN